MTKANKSKYVLYIYREWSEGVRIMARIMANDGFDPIRSWRSHIIDQCQSRIHKTLPS